MSIPNAMKKIIAYFREANHKRLEQRRILKRQGRGQMRFLEQPSARTSFFETLASNQGPGPEFETRLSAQAPTAVMADLVAFYLPQFHPIDENDRWWGTGFTEWRNVARGVPRFKGHYQPRIPRDHGHYDLSDGTRVLHQQAEAARHAGVRAFCFHYYNFDGRRLLERPVENFLADPSIDIGFCLNWANENWSRRWDGNDQEVLLEQTYDPAGEADFAADVCRHFVDPRYLRVGDRPLFIFYRPGLVPDIAGRLARFRQHCQDRIGVNPYVLMVQGFGSEDPRPWGFDGAIEFPPHKLGVDLPQVDYQDVYDPRFLGTYCSYDALVERSLAVESPDFDLIRTVVPNWDNEARKPGRGFGFVGSTPLKYERWLARMIDHARAHPAAGQRALVFVNAWNEWAEGAYLEPDVHYGHAYLNATRRAVCGATRVSDQRHGVLLVGHDAQLHGAQQLLLNIGAMLQRRFGVPVRFLLVQDGGPLLDAYRQIGPAQVLQPGGSLDDALESLGLMPGEADGLSVITNTVVTGEVVSALRKRRMRIVSLIHELGHLIRERQLEDCARGIAQDADVVVFPSAFVEASFDEVAGGRPRRSVVRPQGIYGDLRRARPDRAAILEKLGLPAGARLVVNAGYADLRKGFDLFVELSKRQDLLGDDVFFLWVGRRDPQLMHWLETDPVMSQSSHLRLLDFTDQVLDYVAVADVFALTSREDPFPSVMLEALALGVPVVAFADTGGSADVLAEPGCGTLVEKCNVTAMAQAVRDRVREDDDAARERRSLFARSRFDMAEYVFDLLTLLRPGLRKVSVVVTSYNHQDHLEARLASLFAQTYPVYEIRCVDDASSDASVERARRYCESVGREVDITARPVNSGSAFGNWSAAVASCRGDHVWIAEADDLVEPTFLAEMLAAGADRAALAFCDSRQIDARGKVLAESYNHYYETFWPSGLREPLLQRGADFVRERMAVFNPILNVSGVLFEREPLDRALQAAGQDIRGHRLAGDWRLYIEVLLQPGAQVVYVPRSLNVHRRHAQGVTQSLAAERHLDEVHGIHRHVAERLDVSPQILRQQADYLARLKQQLMPGAQT